MLEPIIPESAPSVKPAADLATLRAAYDTALQARTAYEPTDDAAWDAYEHTDADNTQASAAAYRAWQLTSAEWQRLDRLVCEARAAFVNAGGVQDEEEDA